MTEPTSDGATAAATHYLALYREASSTGDTTAMAAMASASCSFCEHMRGAATASALQRSEVPAAPVTVTAVDSTPIGTDGVFRVHLVVERGRRDSDLPHEQGSDARTSDFVFTMSWLDDRWRVADIDIPVRPLRR